MGCFQGRAALPGTACSLTPDKWGRGLRTWARGLERPKSVSRAPLGWLAAGWRERVRYVLVFRQELEGTKHSGQAQPQGVPPALGVGLGFHHGPLPQKYHPREKTAFCSSRARREGEGPGEAATGLQRAALVTQPEAESTPRSSRAAAGRAWAWA